LNFLISKIISFLWLFRKKEAVSKGQPLLIDSQMWKTAIGINARDVVLGI
jgi:hypothetical protein